MQDKNYGIRVARKGYSVNKSSEAEDSFNSTGYTLKIHKVITVEGKGDNFGYWSGTVEHNLGYRPITMAMYYDWGTFDTPIFQDRARKQDQVNPEVDIYKNHIEQVKEQLTREPYELPKLVISDRAIKLLQETGVDAFDYLTIDDFQLDNYKHHPKLTAPMAV